MPSVSATWRVISSHIAQGRTASAVAGKSILIGVVFSVALILGGCIQIPTVQRSPQISAELLRQHVEFLAQPALEGRAPRTGASRVSRQYIVSRLEAYGLTPWGTATLLEEPFVIGTNVVGVLPGSDPDLAGQFVFLTAHYDHVGRPHFLGKVYPGACDNASGVSALLEVAQTLSQRTPRPRRSIVFAFFDCEEMGCLGSTAFTCRADFDPRAVAAVINLDMLGRHIFDLPDDTLIVVGSENYPLLRAQAHAACQARELSLLPLGRDLVGPCSDHVAFEGLDIPALFLCNWPYRDYHKHTDTAEKLDYSLLERQALAAADMAAAIADVEQVPIRTSLAGGDIEELAAILKLFRKVAADPQAVGIAEPDLARMHGLAAEAERLLVMGAGYSARDRRRFMATTKKLLLPIVLGHSLTPEEEAITEFIVELYALHPGAFTRFQRLLVNEIMARKPDFLHPFGRFEHEEVVIDDNSVRLIAISENLMRLSLFVINYQIDVTIDRLGGVGIGINAAPMLVGNAAGKRDELVDYCLLQWLAKGQATTPVWRYILKQLTGQDHGDDVTAWLDTLQRVPAGMTRGDWVRRCLRDTNPDVARAAVAALANGSAEQPFTNILRDPTAPLLLRYQVMTANYTTPGRTLLGALADMVEDQTPVDPKDGFCVFDESFPFADQVAKQLPREWLEVMAPTTLGQTAIKVLKARTNLDHGSDAHAWRKTVELSLVEPAQKDVP